MTFGGESMNKTLNQFKKTIEDILRVKDVQSSPLLDPINKGKWSIREIVGHLYYSEMK